ncbi:MAG TPA: alpha/beta fold hydrolase [Candidatus Angelobacter sp.]|jgi:dienelactone hydrolase
MFRYSILFLLLASFLPCLNCAAQQLPAERVIDLSTPDNATLKATFFPSVKPGPGVLLLHQCNRQRKVWDALARQLAAAGINVLTVDLPGFGESSGTPYDKLSPQEAQAQGKKWPADIDVAFQYLTSQPGVRREVIGVGGASCGVDNSIQTARRHPREVKSLVLLSGGTDYSGRQFLRQANQLPVFAAMADDDEFRQTVEIMPWVFSLSSNPGKQFVHYATGGHGADMFAVHPELRGKIVDLYVTTLIKSPGQAPAATPAWVAPPSAEVLNLMEQPGGPAKVAQKLQDARKVDPKAVFFDEANVNFMGYEHLQAGDTKGALEILKLNAIAFPESPNVYDSLSDLYVATGEKDLARQNASKALELVASDTKDPEQLRNAIRDSAQQKLKQLGPSPQ